MSGERAIRKIKEQLLLTARESLLIGLLFNEEEPAREQELYQNLVFDNERQSVLLLLARLAKRSGYAYAPKALVARLQGLLRYHGVSNKTVMQPAVSLLDGLNGQPVMLYGSSAMYAYYDEGNPRIMGIGELCVEPGKGEAALRSAEAAGFQIQTESSLAALLNCGQGKVNLHKLLHPRSDSEIWARRRQIRFQNRAAWVTDCADTLILLLRSEFRRWCILSRPERNIKWYFDCACLIRHPSFPGWETVAARAKELGSAQTVHFMMSLFDRSVPGWIPKDFLDKLWPDADHATLAPVLQYGALEAEYADTVQGSLAARVAGWVPRMHAKYHYLNSEIAYSDQPVSLGRMLRQHWGVESLKQVPALFRNRRLKKSDEREE